MARPAKTYDVLTGEGRSHRTKSELEARKNAEKSLLTGERMKESAAVKADKAAHAHWLRVKKLMGSIGRDDAMHENGINRYCLLLSECDGLEKTRAELSEQRRKLENDYLQGEIDSERYEARDGALFARMMKADSMLEKKRSMLLSIEKENLLTVASGMRAVPKKAAEEEPDPMAEMLTMRPTR